MSVIWQKIFFDIWQRKGRTALVVMSIAAGVFAIGTIFGMVDQLLSTMDTSHQSTNPSHVNVILRPWADPDTLFALENIEGVSGVEPVNIRGTRYRAGDADWKSATIVMRADFADQTFDQLTLLEGEWPSGNQIAVERKTQEAFDIQIGDFVTLEVAGTDRAYEVSGLIRHPFVPPPEFGGDAHFMVGKEIMARLGVPEGSYNQLYLTVEPYSEAYARDRMVAVTDRLNKQNIGIIFSIYQDPTEHWGRAFVLGVTYVLRVLAVVSLMASVILVINTMTAVITQQTDQIGVIKAIGGTTNLITRIYLAGVLIYGLLAAFISLPAGMLAGYLASRWLLNTFNIDYAQFAFSERAVVYQVLAALVAPLIAALWPVLKGAWISVREAIASYGIGGDFGSSWLDRKIEMIGARFLSSLYAIALGNLFRRKGRLMLTQGVLITAGTMFMLVLTLSNSLTFTLESELNRRGYDLRYVFPIPYRTEKVADIAAAYPEVTEIEGWYTINGTVLRDGEVIRDTAGLGAELFAIPPGSDMYEPNIISGRWLLPDETGKVVVISRETAEFNGVNVGDVITIDLGQLGDADWEIIGIYQAITAEPFATDPIYAPEPAVIDVTKQINQVTQLLMRIEPSEAAVTQAVKSGLEDDFERNSIVTSAFITRTIHEERQYAYEQFSIVSSMLMGLSAVMAIVGGVGLTGALSISVVERTREIGVLRAIGAESQPIMRMFIMEGVLQGIMSWLISVPISFLIARPMSTVLGTIMLDTGLDFAFAYSAVFLWLVIVIAISTAASVLPALNATRISVRESLAYG